MLKSDPETTEDILAVFANSVEKNNESSVVEEEKKQVAIKYRIAFDLSRSILAAEKLDRESKQYEIITIKAHDFSQVDEENKKREEGHKGTGDNSNNEQQIDNSDLECSVSSAQDRFDYLVFPYLQAGQVIIMNYNEKLGTLELGGFGASGEVYSLPLDPYRFHRVPNYIKSPKELKVDYLQIFSRFHLPLKLYIYLEEEEHLTQEIEGEAPGWYFSLYYLEVERVDVNNLVRKTKKPYKLMIKESDLIQALPETSCHERVSGNNT